VNGAPVVAGGLVYVGSQNAHVYALDPASNLDIVWKWDTGAPILSSVAVVDRAVYVATIGGQVIAIAPVATERLAETD
jgi:outer membrane protein assembly factor BamB